MQGIQLGRLSRIKVGKVTRRVLPSWSSAISHVNRNVRYPLLIDAVRPMTGSVLPPSLGTGVGKPPMGIKEAKAMLSSLDIHSGVEGFCRFVGLPYEDSEMGASFSESQQKAMQIRVKTKVFVLNAVLKLVLASSKTEAERQFVCQHMIWLFDGVSSAISPFFMFEQARLFPDYGLRPRVALGDLSSDPVDCDNPDKLFIADPTLVEALWANIRNPKDKTFPYVRLPEGGVRLFCNRDGAASELGHGRYKRVRVAWDVDPKGHVQFKAVAKLHVSHWWDLKEVWEEAEMVRLADHPAILKGEVCHYRGKKRNMAFIFPRLQPFVTDGSLDGIRKAFGPIGDALCALHRNNIYHNDVKVANFLMDEGGTPFLADFGHSVAVDQGFRITSDFTKVKTQFGYIGCAGGTYYVPEWWQRTPITVDLTKIDTWAFGLAMLSEVDFSTFSCDATQSFNAELYLKPSKQTKAQRFDINRAYSGPNPLAAFVAQMECLSTYLKQNGNPQERQFADIISKSLAFEPQRASMEQIMNMVFF